MFKHSHFPIGTFEGALRDRYQIQIRTGVRQRSSGGWVFPILDAAVRVALRTWLIRFYADLMCIQSPKFNQIWSGGKMAKIGSFIAVLIELCGFITFSESANIYFHTRSQEGTDVYRYILKCFLVKWLRTR
jgi:hypothetical protein